MKYYITIPILLCFSTCFIFAKPASFTRHEHQSTLRRLREQAVSFRDKPEEVGYLKALLQNSIAADSIESVYYALSNLSRYYYNLDRHDSLNYCTYQIDSLVLAKKDNPDAYYDVHSLISKALFSQGHIERSIDEAIKLQKKAVSSNQVYGQICSSEALGRIYKLTEEDSLAISHYQEALTLLDQMNGDLYYRIYILSNQIQSILRMPDQTETEKYLRKYNTYISEWEASQQSKQSATNLHRWLMYSFYTDYCLKTDQLGKAKEYLDKSIAYGQQIETRGVVNLAVALCYFMQATYYNKVGKYPQALNAVDSILIHVPEPELILKKIDILSNMGRYEEASFLYKDFLESTESKNKQAFARQIDQLRELQNVNDKEEKRKELNISEMLVKQKQRQFLLSLVVMALMLVAVYALAMLLKHFLKLKKALEKEKQALLNSQIDIRKAKVKAEKTSQMKSAFIANISHEIRTPLSAIVGFSSLVVDPSSDQEERKEYAAVINNNSDLLLNIVNDVLDLSRMDKEALKFDFHPTDIGKSGKEAIASVQKRVKDNVRLTLTLPPTPFLLTTDPLRIQQLLLNLLTNAIKFTKEGEINLTIEVNGEKQQVRFIVTDTGCGIPFDKQEKIFERFEKLNNFVQGAGLGLSISRMIAEYLGGSLSVDPSYTTGARFIFTHPFHVPI